jgi:hypothetical protein
MPGIVGAFGCRPEMNRFLWEQFDSVWEGAYRVHFDHGMLGGHAFPPLMSVRESRSCILAVDGDAAVYASLSDHVDENGPPLYETDGDSIHLTSHCRGNLALVDLRVPRCYLATEWSGSFPLYYAFPEDGGLVFGSQMRSLAQIAGTESDPVGMLEFLRDAAFCTERTPW